MIRLIYGLGQKNVKVQQYEKQDIKPIAYFKYAVAAGFAFFLF
jgi:hypothetical protein